MGRINMNKLGFSGKIGPVVAYTTKYGKQVYRKYTIPRDPKTPKQLAHRMKFSLANKGLSPLNSSIKLGYRGNTFAYRSLVGKAYREAIMGNYPNFTLDYSKINIADGRLQLPADIKIDFDSDTSSALFSWDRQIVVSQSTAKDNDQINIVAFNVKHNVVIRFLEIAKRLEGLASIALPDCWELDDTHFWVYFSSYSLQMNSESVYVV
jgi:hypothetical protein